LLSAFTFQIAPEYVAAFQKTRTGALVRVELANQYGWKVGDHIPLMSGTAQLSGPTDWASDWDSAKRRDSVPLLASASKYRHVSRGLTAARLS
jgi:hypothetical protein